MKRNWRKRPGFLAEPSAAPASRPSRPQAVALISVIVLAATVAAAVSWLVKPSRAQAFDLVHGSIYINDVHAPVAVDLASGKPTVRLVSAYAEVGTDVATDLQVQPLEDGTLLLDSRTGEFNMIDATGFVIKLDGGVPLPPRTGTSRSFGVPAGSAAFIVRSAPTQTDVYLVNQATVQTAATRATRVDPRAFRTILDGLAPGDGSVAAANGSLWLLTGAGAAERLWHLTLPDGSKNGVVLGVSTLRALAGPSAIGVATLNDDGSGGDSVAIAAADHIDVVTPDGATRTVHFPAIAGLDRLLPATNEHGREAFLYHGADGWGMVSVGADGTRLSAPRALSGETPGQLIAPAASRGSLYTMDVSSGKLLAINSRADVTLSDPAGYPLSTANGRPLESADYSDAYVIARGSRAIYDSPNHSFAVTIFTDGSHSPQLIDKSAATKVDASGGAAALTQGHATPGDGNTTPSKQGEKPPPAPAQAINPTLNCTKSTELPHIPVFTRVEPGSRSVQLAWSYPQLDEQDCIPSTYTVSVKLITPNAPSPPSTVTVQGQTGVNLVGLFPSTQYAITVTAYINGRGTSSQAAVVNTGPEGPAAPTDVHVTTQSSGDWTITWQSCGGLRADCVPALSWDIVPRFCDSYGLSGAPAVVNVIGDPTLHTFTATVKGGGALLGRALSFDVQGEGEQNAKGTPSKQTACAQSWSPPVAAAISLTASQPTDTSLGGTASTTVTANLGTNARQAVGGLGGTVTFVLSNGSTTVSKQPIAYDGSSSVISTTFSGLQAGIGYSASAKITPPAHASAAVTVGPVAVTTRADWPAALGATATCPASGILKLQCTLTIDITGLSSSAARGETFDLTDKSRLLCGNRATTISETDFDPATTTITQNVSLASFNGTCEVDLQLVENPADAAPLVFGGTTSPVLTVSVSLGQAQTLDAKSGDFDANWAGSSDEPSYVLLQYTDNASHSGYTDSQVAALTGSWSEQITAPDGTSCGTDNGQPTHDGIHVVPKASCVNSFGNKNGWQITVSYTNADGSDGNTFTYTLSGTPPGFVPCTVDPAQFAAQWAGTANNPAATLAFNGKDADLAGCSTWSYDLLAPDGSTCNSGPRNAPSSSAPISIDAKCKDNPSLNDWSIRVTYHNPDSSTGTFTVQVSGTPPP